MRNIVCYNFFGYRWTVENKKENSFKLVQVHVENTTFIVGMLKNYSIQIAGDMVAYFRQAKKRNEKNS